MRAAAALLRTAPKERLSPQLLNVLADAALTLGPLAADRDGAPAWEAPALLVLDFRLWLAAPREALAQLPTALGGVLKRMDTAGVVLLGGVYVLRNLCALATPANAEDAALKAVRIGARGATTCPRPIPVVSQRRDLHSGACSRLLTSPLLFSPPSQGCFER